MTLDGMKEVIERCEKVVTTDGFNCDEVNWEMFKVGKGNTWKVE